MSRVLYIKIDFFKNTDFSKVPSNMITNIYKDIVEVFNKISQAIMNAVNNKSVPKKQKAQHYLIIYTESDELIIYNAMTGIQIFSKYLKIILEYLKKKF